MIDLILAMSGKNRSRLFCFFAYMFISAPVILAAVVIAYVF